MTEEGRLESARQGKLGAKEIEYDNRGTFEALWRYSRTTRRIGSELDSLIRMLDEHVRGLTAGPLRAALSALITTIREAEHDEDVVEETATRIETLLNTVTVQDLRAYEPPRVATAEDRALVLDRQKGLCFSCETLLTGYWELDHHLPRKLGGGDGFENRRALCVECNRTKAAQHPDVFYAVKEFA